MVDRNTTLQNKDDIKESNSISMVKSIIHELLEYSKQQLNNRIKFIIFAQLIIAFKYIIIGH